MMCSPESAVGSAWAQSPARLQWVRAKGDELLKLGNELRYGKMNGVRNGPARSWGQASYNVSGVSR